LAPPSIRITDTSGDKTPPKSSSAPVLTLPVGKNENSREQQSHQDKLETQLTPGKTTDAPETSHDTGERLVNAIPPVNEVNLSPTSKPIKPSSPKNILQPNSQPPAKRSALKSPNAGPKKAVTKGIKSTSKNASSAIKKGNVKAPQTKGVKVLGAPEHKQALPAVTTAIKKQVKQPKLNVTPTQAPKLVTPTQAPKLSPRDPTSPHELPSPRDPPTHAPQKPIQATKGKANLDDLLNSLAPGQLESLENKLIDGDYGDLPAMSDEELNKALHVETFSHLELLDSARITFELKDLSGTQPEKDDEII